MNNCKKGIVECLRDSGIEPIASSKSVYNNNYPPSLAITSTISASYYFHSSNGSPQWWMVDFTTIVGIGSYSIVTDGVGCDWIKKWKASVATNDDDWKEVDMQPEAYPRGELYVLNKTYKARYFKLETFENVCSYYMAFRRVNFYGYTNAKNIICKSSNRKAINTNILRIIALVYS